MLIRGLGWFDMTTEQLAEQLLTLPIADRVVLAQALWESIHQSPELGLPIDAEAIQTALRRDAELESGAVTGRTHEDVMRAARRAIGCD